VLATYEEMGVRGSVKRMGLGDYFAGFRARIALAFFILSDVYSRCSKTYLGGKMV
jgi:hypothetical protein